MLIQLVFLIVFAIALGVVWKRAKERVISVREAMAWSVLWVGGAIVVLLPQTSTTVAHLFGIGRGADLMMYASVIVLFSIVFRLMIALDVLEQKLAKLGTAMALKDVDQKKNS